MNKELSLDERIQKLFESGWVDKFNYLENQLQEARYLLACLNEKYNQLTNNWNELEEWINRNCFYDDDTLTYEELINKMEEIKGDNNK